MNDRTRDRIVGVSISKSPDLADLGLGEEHLNEMMVSIARTVLRLGSEDQPVSLAYGGDLRPGGFLDILFPLARGEDPSGRDWNGRLYSVLAWPNYLELSKSDEAELINSCRFVRVEPHHADLGGVEAGVGPADPDTPEAKYQVSRCLTRMREVMTSGEAYTRKGEKPDPLSARIIIGGQTAGYSGFMPGLFEEFLLAHQNKVPTYIIGSYGGAAGALARAILGTSGTEQKWFDLEFHQEQERNKEKKLRELVHEYEKHEKEGIAQPATYYEALEGAIEHCKANVAGELNNGLSTEENERLMVSEQETEILDLLGKGLTSALAR